MIRILILLVMFSLGESLFAQGQISRPRKSASKESLKIVGPDKGQSKQQINKTEQILPNSIESINGITVHWNDVSLNQKKVITEIINNMVYIEGGSFMMGSESGTPSNRPIHKEFVSSFYLSKYEVTQKEYEIIMGNNPSTFIGEQMPVHNVSRNMSIKFLNTLKQLTGIDFRLPKEVEWEFAARGGVKSQGYKYPGSNLIEDVAWYSNNSNNKPHPVGTKLANELGLFDMAGNVTESLADGFSMDYNSPRDIEKAMHRGGGYGIMADFCLVGERSGYYTPDTYGGVGLRIAI